MYNEEDVTKDIKFQVTRDENTGEVTVTICVEAWEKLWHLVDIQNDLIRSLSNGNLGISKDDIEAIRREPSKIASRRFEGKSRT